VKVLGDSDLDPVIMQHHILEMLNRTRPDRPLALNLNGAGNTARFLDQWVQSSHRSD